MHFISEMTFSFPLTIVHNFHLVIAELHHLYRVKEVQMETWYPLANVLHSAYLLLHNNDSGFCTSYLILMRRSSAMLIPFMMQCVFIQVLIVSFQHA
jgi:hypothetical protein